MNLGGALNLLGGRVKVANRLGPNEIVGNRTPRIAQRSKARLSVELDKIALNGTVCIYGTVAIIGIAMINTKERVVYAANDCSRINGNHGTIRAHFGNRSSELVFCRLHGSKVSIFQRSACFLNGGFESLVRGSVRCGAITTHLPSNLNVPCQLLWNGNITIIGIELFDLPLAKGAIKDAQLIDLSLESGHISLVFMLTNDEFHHTCGQVFQPSARPRLLPINIQRHIAGITRLGDNNMFPTATPWISPQADVIATDI